MRVLFATTGTAAHVEPLVPFAHACLRAGHAVLVAGQAGAAPHAARAGLPFRPLAEPSVQAVARFRRGQDGLPADRAAERTFTDLHVRLHGRAALPGMLGVIEDWAPDVVVRESAEVASMVAADRLGVPHAQVAVGLSSRAAHRLLPHAVPRLDELRAAAGLAADPAGRSARSPVLTLVPRSLDDPSAPPSAFVSRHRAVADPAGPAPPDWGDPAHPLVAVSVATGAPASGRDDFPDLQRRVVQALAGLPLRIALAIGDGRSREELGRLPAAVRVERRLPPGTVGAAAAMIGDGAAGPVLTALAADVPMVLLPRAGEEPANARRVAELGAGVALDRGPASVPALRRAVLGVLGQPGYAASARRIADEMAALPPVDAALDLLAVLAEGRRRAA